MEVDEPADTTKIRERTEGAATAVQAMRGDCFSAGRVESGSTTNSTSFGVRVGPPALPCRDDSVVESGAAAFESCLPSIAMRPLTAAGGLVSTGKAYTASETTSNEALFRFYKTEEMNPESDSKLEDLWTLTPSASYDSSSFWRLSATSYCRRVVDTKSGQNRTFDPGGSRGHLHACHVFGTVALVGLWRGLTAWSSWRRAVAFFRWSFVTSSMTARGCQGRTVTDERHGVT